MLPARSCHWLAPRSDMGAMLSSLNLGSAVLDSRHVYLNAPNLMLVAAIWLWIRPPQREGRAGVYHAIANATT
jgi:hypothetical protein